MTLTVKKIHRKLSEYKEIKALYRSAFPPAERFPGIVLRLMITSKIIEPLAFYDHRQLCGFVYLIAQEKVVFIMYLAVNNRLRGKGYGSAILDEIKKRYPDHVLILDVEEMDEQAENAVWRRRRIDFYKRNGLYETKAHYTMRGVRYLIMSTKEDLTEADYNAFWENVYKKKTRKKKEKSE